MRGALKAGVGVGLPLLALVLLIQAMRPPIPEPPPPPALEDAEPAGPTPLPEGTWRLDADGSYVGYRIVERDPSRRSDNEAVGRTGVVEGHLTVTDGAISDAAVTADLSTLHSGERRRDRAIRVRYLESETYPDAQFTLTERLRVGDRLAAGDPVDYSLAGTLEIRGIEREVTVDLSAQWSGEEVLVVGSIPVRLADFGAWPPRILRFRLVEDHGTIEVRLRFAPDP